MAETNPEKLVAPSSPKTENESGHSTTSRVSAAGYPAFEIPASLPQPPFIDVGGVANFRELGGYLCSPYGAAKPTHVLRRSVFYRCAHPTQITPEGGRTLNQTLGVKAIYDLRSAPEVARTTAAAAQAAGTTGPVNPLAIANEPSVIAGVTRHFTPVYTAEDYSPEALARKLIWYKAEPIPASSTTDTSSLGPYSEGFVNAYRDISTHGAQAYTTMFRHILNTPSDPFAFHCTAGKDRTGVFGALIMKLAGVDEETICWEYALTEPGLGSWREMFITRMTAPKPRTPGSSASDNEITTRDQAARIAGSRGPNMRAYLRLILEAELGGVETYLSRHCGFTREEIEEIRTNIITPLDQVDEKDIIHPVEIPGWTVDGGVEDGFDLGGNSNSNSKSNDNTTATDTRQKLPLDPNADRNTEQKVMIG